ncbi:putative 2-aminoethylphosphonate transport system permease protein PhnU [Tepidimonas alkaliphilus]|uniref:Putative 2-aminoethylphosphonate transport system permease protein PhnU n=1 Tax=Tepidimonas alkaliphilus TaxID=2588942 RepID=A0A554WCT4_9BURK|nr:iron ABC transporter permease [Tepidimonas alkaliphilus]TSE21392.1 putative 2-aminoethylphosphonate transport system permease protein PhnU [Tepidimonas alkaliphilus]
MVARSALSWWRAARQAPAYAAVGRSWFVPAALALLAAVLALPVLALLVAALSWNDASWSVLRSMAATTLPGYAGATLALCVMVGLGVALVGSVTALTVTVFDFPGRRSAQWLLLLPLAMPAYVTAYAYTDFLQFSGPAQTWLRETFGLQGRVLPEVRSLWGAAWVFTFTLYPYVYLLARTALADRAAALLEAARLLGAPLRRRLLTVALPLARPAIVAGVALALMETLADFGVVSYFGVQTLTAGVFKAWLVMDDQVAAAQLAWLLLMMVALLLALERVSRRRLRYSSNRVDRAAAAEARPVRLRGAAALAAWLVCGLPVGLGFGLPVLFMLRPLIEGWDVLPWQSFGGWARNSLTLAAMAAALTTLGALALAYAQRQRPTPVVRLAVRTVGLGYAVPGAVLVVGLLLPVGWLQAAAPQAPWASWVTATVLGVLWAYWVRYTAVALQSLESGYSRVPSSLDDAARLLGRRGWRLWASVHLPLLHRSVWAAALLVFVDVMKELPATLVLRPFGWDTLAVVAHQMARDERLGEAALPALTLVLAGLVPVLLLSRALRRGETTAC